MTPFIFNSPADAADAVRQGAIPNPRYLVGGTTLVDLMRETLERPTALVSVTGRAKEIPRRTTLCS